MGNFSCVKKILAAIFFIQAHREAPLFLPCAPVRVTFLNLDVATLRLGQNDSHENPNSSSSCLGILHCDLCVRRCQTSDAFSSDGSCPLCHARRFIRMLSRPAACVHPHAHTHTGIHTQPHAPWWIDGDTTVKCYLFKIGKMYAPVGV